MEDLGLPFISEGSTMESRTRKILKLTARIKESSSRGEFDRAHFFLLELKKLQCEEKNARVQSKGQNVNEKVNVRLNREDEDHCNRILDKKDELISKLKGQLLESEKFLAFYLEKFNCLNAKLSMVEREVEKLKVEKLLAEQNGEELRCQILRNSEALEKLRTEKSRANEELLEVYSAIEELTRQKLEAYQKVEELKTQLSEEAAVEKRITNEHIEEARSKLFDVNCLTAKLQQLVSEIKTLKDEKMVFSQAKEQIVELKERPLEADMEKRKSDKTIEEMMGTLLHTDCLNVVLQERESEIKTFNKLLDAQIIEEMTLQNLEASEMVGWKKKLIETEEKLRWYKLAAETQKRRLDDTILEMRTEKLRFDEEQSSYELEASVTIEELTCQNVEVVELKRQLAEAVDIQKKKSDETIQEIIRNNVEVDFLNRKVGEMESELKKLKEKILLDAKSMEELKSQNAEASKKVEGLEFTFREVRRMNLEESVTIQELRRNMFAPDQAAEASNEKAHEGGRVEEASETQNPHIAEPNDIIVINDSDSDDETEHSLSVKSPGYNYANLDKKESTCKKRNRSSHGEEDDADNMEYIKNQKESRNHD